MGNQLHGLLRAPVASNWIRDITEGGLLEAHFRPSVPQGMAWDVGSDGPIYFSLVHPASSLSPGCMAQMRSSYFILIPTTL